MLEILDTNYLHAVLLNFKRMEGIPFTKKILYVFKTFLGETLRVRSCGLLSLRLVEISLTDRCQCRCKHCFAAHENDIDLIKEELTTYEVISLLDEIARIGGVEVCFSGGEPLIRKDILELVNLSVA